MQQTQGLLAYSLVPARGDKPAHLACLLWKSLLSTVTQSAEFWTEVVCPGIDKDTSALESVCRGFSDRTRSLFAPTDDDFDAVELSKKRTRKAYVHISVFFVIQLIACVQKERFALAQDKLRQKIRASTGCCILSGQILSVGSSASVPHVSVLPLLPFAHSFPTSVCTLFQCDTCLLTLSKWLVIVRDKLLGCRWLTSSLSYDILQPCKSPVRLMDQCIT